MYYTRTIQSVTTTVFVPQYPTMTTSFDKIDSSTVYECGISHRINSRSISWNSIGTTMAMAGSDRSTKLYSMSDLMSNSSSSSSSQSQVRELSNISGHADRVRFHPNQDSVLATASGNDSAVKLWDVRSSAAKASGTIDLTGSNSSNGSNVDISWSPIEQNLLVVTEKNGAVHVVDTRKLENSNKTPTSASAKKRPAFQKSFFLKPKIIDACLFSPSGDHLVAATSAGGYGELTVWNWTSETSETSNYVYPAHTGPIYSACFSPNGQTLATGGGDALVGLWDVNTMVCASTMTRCDRFVRSVSFSFDSQILATSTEEATLDLANPHDGSLVGSVSMSSSSRRDRNAPGADEIAFHPKAHLLACARCDSQNASPLTIVKLTLGRQ